MKRLLIVVLSALALVLALGDTALADVYEGTAALPAPVQPPSLTPEAPITQQRAYMHSVTVTYDSSAGSLKIVFGYYEPDYWASRFAPAVKTGPEGEVSEGLVVGEHFGFDVWLSEDEVVAPQLEGQTKLHISPAGLGIEGIRASVERLGYNGALSSPVTYSAGLYTVLFANSALIGLHLESFGLDTSGQELKIYPLRDITPHPTLDARADTSAFEAKIGHPVPSKEDFVCPSVEIFSFGPQSPEMSGCIAEYSYDGRWYLVRGSVTLRGNAYVATISYERSWVRHWTISSRKCLSGQRLAGRLESNDGVCDAQMASDVAYGLRGRRRAPKRVGWHGTDTAGYAIAEYPCHRSGRATVCSNVVGDSFRYTP